MGGDGDASSAEPASTSTSVSTFPEAPRPRLTAPLRLGERFSLELHTTFSPSAFIFPATESAIIMAAPPHKYPPEWLDGPGGFGRNYGAEFVRHTAGGMTHFAVAAIDREDPRYFPSTSTNPLKRTVHALMFTVIDQSDSGRRTLAVSNFAGSAAAGAIGMTFYPDGFDDVTHAYQRAAIEFSTYGSHNLTAEFSPEITRLLRKCHVPAGIASAFLPAEANRP